MRHSHNPSISKTLAHSEPESYLRHENEQILFSELENEHGKNSIAIG